MSELTHAVRLRKPCQHLRYEPHQTLAFRWSKDGMPYDCPGGESPSLDDLIAALNGMGVEGTVRVSYIGPEPAQLTLGEIDE